MGVGWPIEDATQQQLTQISSLTGDLGGGQAVFFELHVASYVGLVVPCNERTASFPAPRIS